MHKKKFTYKNSGVNTRNTSNLVSYISKLSNKTKIKGSFIKGFKNIGGFGSLFDLTSHKIKNPVIVSAADGVGTKIEISSKLRNYKTIGIDLVAMCINDLIVQGAKPLFFLDYIALGKVKNKQYKEIIQGIYKGCKLSNCYLAGGETAEMPGIYLRDKFDLAGFAVGLVNKKKIIDGSKIQNNDVILAYPSNGIHSNGFSLIRKIISKTKIDISRNNFLKKELLKPTKIYAKTILTLNSKNLLKGGAHITGGGLIENILRVIPKNYSISIKLNKIKTKKIFSWIHKFVNHDEMLSTFNCGVGFCIIVSQKNVKKVLKYSKQSKPYVIGKIVKNKKSRVLLNGKIKF